MSDFSRRIFLRNSAVLSGSLALGGLLTARSGLATSLEAQRGGRVRYGVIEGNQAGNLDAHKPVGSGAFRGWALYSKLWEWDLNAQPQLALAEFAEPNHDGTEWIVRLKPGLEFHNGKTIDADDVVFSLLRLTDPQLASPYATYLYSLQRDGVRKLDSRTVRIPFAPGLGLVALPELWMSWGGIVPVDYHPISNPVGAGPYRLKSFTPGQRSLFTRFENYYKAGQPYADEIEILDFSDQTGRLQALQAGQIGIATGVAQEQLPFLSKDPRFSVVSSQTDAWQGFAMNLSKPPFTDDRVRRAFRLLVDRQELVARVLHGHGRIANDLYSPSDPTFNHAIAQRSQDLEQARQLLREAGFDNNLNIELTTTAGAGANAGIVLAQQARKIGVTLKVRQVDASIFNGPGRNDWLFSTIGGVSRPFLLTVQQHDGPRAVANRTHFNHPRFAELITQALAQPDVSKRKELVGEAQQIQHEHGGLIIWGFANVLDAVSTGIGGVTPDRTGFAAWRTDRLWQKGAV